MPCPRDLARLLCLTLGAAGGLASCGSTSASVPDEVAEVSADPRMDWWREARFGLFLHWGLYAIPAGEWEGSTRHAEWILTTAEIPVAEYERFTERFDPVEFDADAWVRLAKRAGMKYVVITSKHHDGFCLFDSEHSDYDVMATPFRRDVLAELAAACERHGLRMCWYHSIMDWHHPDYLPRRGWEERSAEGADYERYVRYLFAQVEELLTRYGPIGVMWFDGEWEGTWSHEHGLALYEHCRRLQPDVIVNNRVDKGRGGMAGMTSDQKYAGDYGTPEQEIPATGLPGVDWETCMTMNRHWGWNRNDRDWKSATDLVRKLSDIASKGGNFLLNVGPKADGTFPQEAVQRLEAIGRWMDVNGEAIHGTTASPFEELPWGRCTTRRRGETTTLYLHVFDWPANGRLVLSGLGNRVLGAHALARPDEELAVTGGDGEVSIALPAEPTDSLCPVVALEVAGPPVVYRTPEILAPADVLVDVLTVEIRLPSDELVVRYTLDGSVPEGTSARYEGPLALTSSTVVRARAFHAGRPVSAIAERRFERVAPLAAERVEDAEPGLGYVQYAGDWDALPDFAALEAGAQWTAPGIGLEPRVRGEHQGLRITGWLTVPADDVYVFGLDSDDGARLSVGGRTVVDNDGLHGPQELTGPVPLAAGAHAIVVEWFNKSGGAELGLRCARAGEPLEPVPAAAFSH